MDDEAQTGNFRESFEQELLRLRNEVDALANANAHAAELMAELREARELEEILKVNNAHLERTKQFERDRGRFLELVARNQPAEVLTDALAEMLPHRHLQQPFSLLTVEGGRIQRAVTAGMPRTFSRRVGGLPVLEEPVLGASLRHGQPCFFRDAASVEQPGPLLRLLLDAGYRSIWCWPAMAGDGTLLGFLAVYSPELLMPTGAEADLMEQVCMLFATGLRHRILTDQLTYQARHDALTGLPNRTSFQELLRRAIESPRGSRIGILWLDLDRFKQINDTLGHRVGDQLLQLAARRIANCVQDRGVAARMGGDEFLILVEDIPDVAAAEAVAQEVVQRFSDPMSIDGQRVTLRVSVGVSVFPDHGSDADTLIRNADLAMYGAKHRGRDTYLCFTPERERRVRERFKLETYLRHALERGELEIHYQPLTSSADGSIQSLEALLRWQSREIGQVSPAEFIPVAEAAGLMVPIGKWVLEQACRHLAQLNRQGHQTRIAINVSPTQLSRGGFAATVRDILHSTGVDPGCVELELTERCLGVSDCQQEIQALREIGVHLSIDDFGTGYSALSYLPALPVNEVKMDRSFVAGLGTGESATRLVEAIVALAKALQLRVVAEGVETEEQVRLLQELGCDLLQGYYLHRPMPWEQIQRLLSGDPGVKQEGSAGTCAPSNPRQASGPLPSQ